MRCVCFGESRGRVDAAEPRHIDIRHCHSIRHMGEAALSISWLEAGLLTGQQSFIGLISTTEKVEIPVSNLRQWGHLQLLQTVQSHLQRVTQRPPHHPRKVHDAETRIQTPIPPGR